MLDTATGELLQVEINTIASSFAALGSLVASLHRYSCLFLACSSILLFHSGLFSFLTLWWQMSGQ